MCKYILFWFFARSASDDDMEHTYLMPHLGTIDQFSFYCHLLRRKSRALFSSAFSLLLYLLRNSSVSMFLLFYSFVLKKLLDVSMERYGSERRFRQTLAHTPKKHKKNKWYDRKATRQWIRTTFHRAHQTQANEMFMHDELSKRKIRSFHWTLAVVAFFDLVWLRLGFFALIFAFFPSCLSPYRPRIESNRTWIFRVGINPCASQKKFSISLGVELSFPFSAISIHSHFIALRLKFLNFDF